MQQININSILTNLIQNQIDIIFATIKNKIEKPIKELKTSFNKYLISSYSRISITKTLLYKDNPVSIDEIYVDPDLSLYDKTVKLTQIVDDLEPNSKYIISATAGAGKSILAKKLFISIIEKEVAGIPIFFELRNLNNSNKCIIDSLIELFDSYGISLDKEYLEKLFLKSKFVLILDGYDEIDSSLKKEIDEELKYLIAKFNNTPIFITTRPDDSIEALPDFYILRVKPLDKEKAIELVKKLKYDTKVKEKFIKKLGDKLFDKHEDFLSNPLLLTIMLMTYSQIAEIPEKMHIFYEQAFDALYFRHDALKSLYKRNIRTKLSVDDFKKILSIISFNSFFKSQVNFSNSNLMEHIRTAKKLTGLQFNNDDYKYDLLKSVCILINDGTKFTYTHRSFQEYFAAHFISFFSLSKKLELLKKLLLVPHSNVLSLSFEMNSSNIEKNLIIPIGQEYIELYKKTENDSERLKICFDKIVAIKTPKNRKHYYKVVERAIYWYFIIYFEQIYSRKYKSISPKYKKTLTKKSFVEVFGEGEVEEEIDVNENNIEKLRKLGVIEIQEKRVAFLQKVLEKVIKRDKEIEINLEEYL